MVDVTSLKSRIDTRVFTGLGSSALWSSLISGSNTEWGDKVRTYATGTTIKVIPYNFIFKQINYQKFGDLNAGEADWAMSPDYTIHEEDQFTLNGVNYIAKRIDYSLLKDVYLVQVVRVRELVSSNAY